MAEEKPQASVSSSDVNNSGEHIAQKRHRLHRKGHGHDRDPFLDLQDDATKVEGSNEDASSSKDSLLMDVCCAHLSAAPRPG